MIRNDRSTMRVTLHKSQVIKSSRRLIFYLYRHRFDSKCFTSRYSTYHSSIYREHRIIILIFIAIKKFLSDHTMAPMYTSESRFVLDRASRRRSSTKERQIYRVDQGVASKAEKRRWRDVPRQTGVTLTHRIFGRTSGPRKSARPGPSSTQRSLPLR